jgi:cytochrome oxidase assembly protein ShyY1
VVVNRGFIADPRPTAATPPAPLPPEPLDIVGVMRWPDRPGWFDTVYSSNDDLWTVRDHRAMAAQYGWGHVAPFYVEMETPAPPGGVPRPGRLKVNLRNEHLQYAITWFGLAGVLVVMFALWAARRRRDPTGH